MATSRFITLSRFVHQVFGGQGYTAGQMPPGSPAPRYVRSYVKDQLGSGYKPGLASDPKMLSTSGMGDHGQGPSTSYYFHNDGGDSVRAVTGDLNGEGRHKLAIKPL